MLKFEPRKLGATLALALASGALGVSGAAAQSSTLCDGISIDELGSLSSLAYESAEADFVGCTYAGPGGAEESYSLRIAVSPVPVVKELPDAFPGGELLRVGDRFAYFLDGSLALQLVDGVVGIEPSFAGAADAPDALAYATQIAEIALPRLDTIITERAELLGAGAEPAEPSLCDVLSVEELDSLSALDFGKPPAFAADDSRCRYPASPLQEGFHGLSIELTGPGEPASAIMMAESSGAAESEVAGWRAFATDGGLLVEVGDRVLTVTPSLDDAPPSAETDEDAFAVAVAEAIIANLDAAE